MAPEAIILSQILEPKTQMFGSEALYYLVSWSHLAVFEATWFLDGSGSQVDSWFQALLPLHCIVGVLV